MDSGNRLAAVLQGRTHMPVVTPEDKQKIEKGCVYVAPPGYHLLVDATGCINYSLSAPVHFCRPAIDELFFSAGHVYGTRLLAALLTGANEDGAAGLAYIRKRGGITVVQSPETAEATVMPEAAIAMDAAGKVLPLDQIASFIVEKVVGLADE
jgi:two-component system chemotaxis response regulator CheB